MRLTSTFGDGMHEGKVVNQEKVLHMMVATRSD